MAQLQPLSRRTKTADAPSEGSAVNEVTSVKVIML
jgi:hypothetical protein